MNRPISVDHAEVVYEARALSGSSQVQLGWSIPVEDEGPLLAGFATWDGQEAPWKTLDYDEILIVLEGVFGFEIPSGERFEGGPNATLRIPKNTPVKYFGTNARIFYVITRPGE